jgi:cell division protein ZapA (FtsZ GTPase activity inhibitor)
VAITTCDDLPALQEQAQAVAEQIRRMLAKLEQARRRAIQALNAVRLVNWPPAWRTKSAIR